LSGEPGDRTDSFTPSRLELARRRRGITKKDLAEKAGVPLRTLQAYMSGEQEPTNERIQTFAHVLAFPPQFFFRPDVEELPLDAVSFRALSKLTARQRDRELASAEIALEFSRWIDVRFRLPEPAVPRLEDLDPENAAAATRREFGLGEQPVRQMIHLLEAHGVRVFSLAEESTDVDAFSFSLGRVPYMFLDTTKSAERTRMDAAHELGHLVMHWGEATPRGREEEQQAQHFAAAFLMPSSSVLSEAPRGAHLSQIMATKQRWGVSASALTVRMHRLGLLTDWQYRSLMIEISRRGLRTKEERAIPPEGSQVLSKVLEAMRSEGKSPMGIAAELMIPPEELNKLVFGLALTGVEGEGAYETDSKTRRSFRLVKGDAS
jgi:Zn-dependent peptidase ImmA (M78 family)/DNA-binding XRE family transcriptional regulator